MTTIVKGDMMSGNASGSFGILNVPADGEIFVADSAQSLGWTTQAAPPALKAGSATLVAGTVVVSDTAVTAGSNILLTAQSAASLGELRVTSKTAATGFTITSSLVTDTGVVSYLIIG